MYGPWAALFGGVLASKKLPTPAQDLEEEKKRPHTYKCECEVTWIAKGLEPQACWACEIIVTPECFHG